MPLHLKVRPVRLRNQLLLNQVVTSTVTFLCLLPSFPVLLPFFTHSLVPEIILPKKIYYIKVVSEEIKLTC